MVEAATTFMFQSMDPGILGAVVLVGIPVVAITLFGIALRYRGAVPDGAPQHKCRCTVWRTGT